MQTVARGPTDGARLVELFGGVRKKKVFLYYSSGTARKWFEFDNDSAVKYVNSKTGQNRISAKLLALIICTHFVTQTLFWNNVCMTVIHV